MTRDREAQMRKSTKDGTTIVFAKSSFSPQICNITEWFTLKRTGEAPLQFHGCLLAKVDTSEHPTNRLPEKWYVAALYMTDAEKYVLHVRIAGQNPKYQPPHCSVQIADSPHAAVMSYDPLRHVKPFPPATRFAFRQNEQNANMRGQWDAAISTLLKQFPRPITP